MISNTNIAEFKNGAVEQDTAGGLISARSAMAIMQNLLRCRFAGKPVRIYEAGGGSVSYLPPEVLQNADITVVDIDETQVRNNSYARTTICGDIQTQEFPADSFDLVVCYNVIEHIERPDLAIRHFLKALAPQGLLFIAAPNPHSFSGLATKYTPHWFHVWFYRAVLGRKDAGLPGNAPFPVVYHPVVSPRKLAKFSEQCGYRVVYFREFESSHLGDLRRERPLAAKFLNAVIAVLEFVARRNLRSGDFHIVVEKPSV